MVVNQLTFTWIMYEFEYRIRQGQLSPLLLKPLHPIHGDIAENITYKALTSVVLVPALVLLVLAFRPALHPEPWTVAAFVPALLLAFLLRFLSGWTLALAGFWTTRVWRSTSCTSWRCCSSPGRWCRSRCSRPGAGAGRLAALPLDGRLPGRAAAGAVEPEETVVGFGVQLVWLAVQRRLAVVVWRAGLRRYSAVGA